MKKDMGKTSLEIADVAEGDVHELRSKSTPGFVSAVDEESQTWGKRLLRKIDWHLLPLMCTSYMIQFLDKQTLAQASIMGFIQDLNLTGNEFSWCGSMFYFGYLAFSYPASLLMVRCPIGKYLAVNFLIWGVILACHAATKSFAGMMLVRFFLGAAESSVSPGFSLITGMWYRREEQPLRHGLWFTGNSAATAVGGLLAYAIAHIHGGLASWKWLFIIYAIITLIWAVLLFIFLPDQPTSARFLSEEERTKAVDRLRTNQAGAVTHKVQWNQVWEALSDYKIWILFFYQIANNIPNGGLTTFSSLVMAGFGFTTLQVYLLSMPTGVIHAFFAVGSTFLAGRFPTCRCLLVAGCTFVALIGCVIIYTTDNQGARLFGYFIFVAYAAGIPLTLSLVSSNVAGFTKKATVGAMMFIAYCVGNIIGPFLFFSREAPKYKSGFLSLIVCFAVAIALILTLAMCWRWENVRRDREYGLPVLDGSAAAGTGDEKEAAPEQFEDLTDVGNHNFRYVY
ncbi:Pantothenate transporter [Pleurostoma richardsiae]|uniref:Pantothenate transporter n=1 Tax=Pleurostoma richardsiae TaxID=41990 RepID=A0AA38RLG6_9PEZI|nr:Pantothenate transporter [Pleurostoma richardsiae]